MITPIGKDSISTGRTPLKNLIKQMQNPTKAEVKKLYGDIGLDIFEGKDKITILTIKNDEQSKNFITKIMKWFNGMGKFDYEEKDSINDLVLKYACNGSFGTVNEIEEKFGQEGKKAAEIFKFMGYLRTGI